jgi:glycosyltransferase involved in cell wall biosynthesis
MRLDYGLLIETMQRLPDLNLVMAGVMSPMVPDLEKLRIQLLALPNVAHVGVLPPDKLSILIDGSIAGLVAYPFEPKQEKPSQPYGSLKPLTYLTHSKPVITTINCYIPELTGKGVYKVENRDEFISAVQQAAEGGIGVDKSTTERYLDEVSYGKLIVKILQAIPPIGV